MKLTLEQFNEIEQRRSAQDLQDLLKALSEDGVIEVKTFEPEVDETADPGNADPTAPEGDLS